MSKSLRRHGRGSQIRPRPRIVQRTHRAYRMPVRAQPAHGRASPPDLPAASDESGQDLPHRLAVDAEAPRDAPQATRPVRPRLRSVRPSARQRSARSCLLQRSHQSSAKPGRIARQLLWPSTLDASSGVARKDRSRAQRTLRCHSGQGLAHPRHPSMTFRENPEERTCWTVPRWRHPHRQGRAHRTSRIARSANHPTSPPDEHAEKN